MCDVTIDQIKNHYSVRSSLSFGLALLVALSNPDFVALGSVKCEYDCGQDPLQQERNRPEPS